MSIESPANPSRPHPLRRRTTARVDTRPRPGPRLADGARPRPASSTPRGDRFVEFAGRVVLIAAWWSLIRLVVPHNRPLEGVDDVFALVNLPTGPSLFSAVLLFVVGGAVRRRMRAAWWLLLGFQIVSVTYTAAVLTGAAEVDDLPAGIDTVAALATGTNIVLSVVAIALLLRSRRAFSASIPPGARSRAAAVVVAGLSVALGTAIGLTLAAPDHLTDMRHRLDWAVRVVFGVRPDRSDIGWAHQHGHPWIAFLAGALSGLTLLAAAFVFVRAGRAGEHVTAQDELTIRGLLARHGEQDSLGYFATRRDKSAVFSPARDAAVTYRVLANVSLASADPLGDPRHWPAAIAAWLRETRSRGWYPAVLAAGEQAAAAYVAAGLKAIPMGDEAIIDTATFTLDGPPMQPVRRATRRIRRLGYTITVQRHADLGAEQLAQLAECADAWRLDGTERGFSMALGRLGEPLDGASVAVLAHDRDGRLRGFLSLVPWGRRGLSLDLMRRDRTSDNGLNEAMVAVLVREARDSLGIARVSLNFAMFRGVFGAAERLGSGPLVRLTSRFMRFASRFWQIESLYRSNARYRPQWETRYLCYDSPLTLTRVSIAAGAAEGFLPWWGGRPDAPADDEPVLFDGQRLPLRQAVRAQEEAVQQDVVRLPHPTQQQRARQGKLDVLRRHDIDPYPVSVPRDVAVASLRRRYAPEPGEHTGVRVSVVGRVRAMRDLGGLLFLVLEEGGATVQAVLSTDRLGDAHELARRTVDLGDLLSVSGEVMATRRGETSVQVAAWQMAAKCLTPVPKLRPAGREPAPGEARLPTSARLPRQLELVAEPAARRLLTLRADVVRAVRAELVDLGYVEAETPMLQPLHGGANARPFATHMNAYDMPLYLRIAPELHLKRLAVAGFGRVFELNRNFRNEGVDDTHNPEFTALEAYRAHADYRDMQHMARDLVLAAARAVHGAPVARRSTPTGATVTTDLSGPWRVVTVHDAVSAACGHTVTPRTPADELRELCRANAVPTRTGAAAGELVLRLYERLVEACTVEPTFYYDFPIDTSPLTRRHRTDPALAERWDLVAWGQEIGTAYSELTDPIEQRRRFVEQAVRRDGGDVEAMRLDEDFLGALSYGMPPTGGLGLGIDRLVMLLTGVPIRQTLAFPFQARGDVLERV